MSGEEPFTAGEKPPEQESDSRESDPNHVTVTVRREPSNCDLANDRGITEQPSGDPSLNRNSIGLNKTESEIDGSQDSTTSHDPMVEQDAENPPTINSVSFPVCCPPGLECLLESGQLVIHKNNLRLNEKISDEALKVMEVIEETRRVLFFAEQEPAPDSDSSFLFKLYDRQKTEVIRVYNPLSNTCVCRGATWHCFKRCHFQALVYAPPEVIVGFIRRAQTCFIQEYEILSPQEDVLLVLRGGGTDLVIYSPDMEEELGRLSIHGWIGIMHEVRRSSGDYGLTFPLDLDVRVKATLLGAVFAIDWLISTKGGRR